jgi:hypothetical protein
MRLDGEWVYKEFNPMALLAPAKSLTMASSVDPTFPFEYTRPRVSSTSPFQFWN